MKLSTKKLEKIIIISVLAHMFLIRYLNGKKNILIKKKGSKSMKKIEIEAKLVQGLLATTVTTDFRLSDNPTITFIKADTTLNLFYVLGIISDEELRGFEEMLYVNYSCFTEIAKGEAKQELNKKFGLNKEGDTN